jgi:hypothetical protein
MRINAENLYYQGHNFMLSEIRQNFKKTMLETGNEALFDLRPSFWDSEYPELPDIYARFFGLCRLLKITDIYDIGCGQTDQAFYLASYPDMFYTGIDCGPDYTHINKLFAKNCGERIKFRYARYPFPINPVSKNIAIAHYSKNKSMYEAFTKDFERIIIDIDMKKVGSLKKSLSDFKLYKITAYANPIVFGTKFPKEIDLLKAINYNFYDDRFAVPYVDC